MNNFEPHFNLLYPPAIVVQAFDVEQAFADIQSAVHDRDEAKGDYKDAILRIGQKLIEARKAMPGEKAPNGGEKFSPAFLAFVERCGLAKHTARVYMGYARDPRRLEVQRARMDKYNKSNRSSRAKLLREVRDLLTKAESLDDAINAIDEELNETR